MDWRDSRAFAVAWLLTGCSSDGDNTPASGTESGSSGEESYGSEDVAETGTSVGSSSSATTGSSTEDGSSDSSSSGSGSTTDAPPACPGADPPTAIACDDDGEPGSFAAQIEWAWNGDVAGGDVHVSTTPLVANLTDDNGDGVIDPCDVPDIVVAAHENVDWADFLGPTSAVGHIWILDGATGAPHARIDDNVWRVTTPAIADLDGDGVAEIVALVYEGGYLRAWRADGTPLEGWTADQWGWYDRSRQPPTIADLVGDGAPSIVIAERVLARDGALAATLPHSVLVDPDMRNLYGNTTVVDLDADGAPELLVGRRAYTWRDDWYWPYYEENTLYDSPAFTHVGDLDGDGTPEVVLTHLTGVSVLDGDGSVIAGPVVPIDGIAADLWRRPAALADLDGDGAAEIAMATADRVLVLRLDDTNALSVIAEWVVEDSPHEYTKGAGPTIFDFHGDGAPEIVYADAGALLVLDPSNDEAPPLLEIPRSSRLELETPVVADVDADGSAEILVVSSEDAAGVGSEPPLRVVGEASWVGARRIWNQHGYRVVGVHEDGSVPSEPGVGGGFRVNARVEGGVLCEG